jgi:hypothetical protein
MVLTGLRDLFDVFEQEIKVTNRKKRRINGK